MRTRRSIYKSPRVSIDEPKKAKKAVKKAVEEEDDYVTAESQSSIEDTETQDKPENPEIEAEVDNENSDSEEETVENDENDDSGEASETEDETENPEIEAGKDGEKETIGNFFQCQFRIMTLREKTEKLVKTM